jgi:hypothetical protein
MAALRLSPVGRCRSRIQLDQCASSSSTSNFNVAFGGITPPAPRAP